MKQCREATTACREPSTIGVIPEKRLSYGEGYQSYTGCLLHIKEKNVLLLIPRKSFALTIDIFVYFFLSYLFLEFLAWGREETKIPHPPSPIAEVK